MFKGFSTMSEVFTFVILVLVLYNSGVLIYDNYSLSLALYNLTITTSLIIFLLLFLVNLKNIRRFSESRKERVREKEREKIREKIRENINDIEKYNFNVTNFQGIIKIQENLPFDSSWIFLTGNNGYGKTNILQALARGLSTFTDNQVYNGIKPLDNNSKIEIDIFNLHRTITLATNHDFDKLNYRVMGYGASRLDMGSDRSTKEYRSCSSLFESQVLLRNIEKEGLSRWFFKENEEYKFEDCVNKFKKILPSLHEVIVDESSNVWYIEKDEQGIPLPKVQFKDLATGYQNIISMVGDIILNLNDERSKKEDISLRDNNRAIVLIDEIELYLHPKLQKELPQLLTDIFPNILFIASTHSPIPLLGAPKNSAMYVVRRSVENGIKLKRLDEKIYIDELLPNTILTSPLFGMNDILSSTFTGEKKLRTESNYSDIEINNIIKNKIDDYMTDKKENDLIKRFHEKNL